MIRAVIRDRHGWPGRTDSPHEPGREERGSRLHPRRHTRPTNPVRGTNTVGDTDGCRGDSATRYRAESRWSAFGVTALLALAGEARGAHLLDVAGAHRRDRGDADDRENHTDPPMPDVRSDHGVSVARHGVIGPLAPAGRRSHGAQSASRSTFRQSRRRCSRSAGIGSVAARERIRALSENSNSM